MSIQAVAWALEQDLPARPKLVLVAIANHANHTDGYCWLRADTIAREASCKPRSVYRFVADLIRNGYLRKQLKRGDDGKQRANDYWILLDRPDAEWITIGGEAPDDAEGAPESDAESHDEFEAETQDVEGVDSLETEPGDSGDSRSAPVDIPVLSPGPGDSGVTHKDSAEPSKTNPEKARAWTPRSYKPPPQAPPQPQGSTTANGLGDFVFVFADTDAYRAWQVVKRHETGRPWAARMTREGKFGWFFPTLYPRDELLKAAEKSDVLATEAELDHFSKTG